MKLVDTKARDKKPATSEPTSAIDRSDVGMNSAEMFVFGLVVGAFVGFTFAAMVLR